MLFKLLTLSICIQHYAKCTAKPTSFHGEQVSWKLCIEYWQYSPCPVCRCY